MKKLLLITFITFTSVLSNAQKFSEQLMQQLEKNEKDMFESVSRGDSVAFKRLAAKEYFTINADGTSGNLAETLKDFGKFKGAVTVLSDQKQRLFDKVALRTGKAKFYFAGQLVAEVLYTSGWAYKNKRWQFIHWQGTLTNLAPPNSNPPISNRLLVTMRTRIPQNNGHVKEDDVCL
jgi:hypothetical protein